MLRKKKDLINFLNKTESFFNETGFNYKINISHPLVEHIFKKEIKSNKILNKTLKNNFKLYFKLDSRITKDFFISSSKFPDHVNEPQTTKLLTKILKKNTNLHCILGGAFIGDMAIPLAYILKYNRDKRIHCFEVDKDAFKLLKKNVRVNKIKCIKANNQALSNNNKYLYLNLAGSSLISLTQRKTKYSQKYKTTTIDEYCLRNKIELLSFIHLDIENNELLALKGTKKFLSLNKYKSPDIIFEFCNYFHAKNKNFTKKTILNSSIIKFLKKYGYHCYAIRDFSSNIGKSLNNIEIIPIENIFHKPLNYCFNVYCTKNKKNISLYNLKVCKNVNPKLLLHEEKRIHWPKHG